MAVGVAAATGGLVAVDNVVGANVTVARISGVFVGAFVAVEVAVAVEVKVAVGICVLVASAVAVKLIVGIN